jgi:hypothetical protein
LNVSQTAANDLNAKLISRMSIRSACEHTVFAPAQLLRNWCEKRPSRKGDLDSSVTGTIGRVFDGNEPASDTIFVTQEVIVVGMRFEWYTFNFRRLIMSSVCCTLFNDAFSELRLYTSNERVINA